MHELPLLGDVWRYARVEYGARDEGIDAERQELSGAIKAFAGQGNAAPRTATQTRHERQRARAKAVADDPMNFTSVKSVEPAESSDRVQTGAIEVEDLEEWPNTGGFPFIGDSLEETRRRISE